MKLSLEAQSTWPVVERAAAGTTPTPHIVIHPGDPLPDDMRSWKKHLVEWSLPAGASARTVSDARDKSLVEWPIDVIEVHVERGGDVVEARLVAVYYVLEYCAAAMWRGPAAQLQSDRARIVGVLASGRPDWRRREIIALSQLYE
jgi:hypothetical protein